MLSQPLQTAVKIEREFAAIDLGSNSFHLIVARIVNGSIQILSRVKRKVRLAEGLDEQYQLSEEAIDRGVECLALFAERLKGFSVENVKVVGTYTLRQAVNNQQFLAKAKTVFPFPIDIISGKEEARLIYTGVCHTQPEKGRKLVIDIGGGSTEMSIGDDFLPLKAESRNMGCVSFAMQFFPNGELSKNRFKDAYQVAMDRIADLAESYKKLGWQHVLGSSGTVKTVSQVLMANGFSDGLITETRLQFLIKRCLGFKSLHHIKLDGLLSERADVLVPGLAILLALFHTYQIDTMRYSDGALREGVMYSLENRFQVEDIRARTAMSLSQNFHIDQAQAERVKQSALQLFEQIQHWKNRYQVNEFRALLSWACVFHEMGLTLNHNGMQYHSAYMLSHLDLPGFDIEQKRLMATLVKHHIKSFKRRDTASTARYQRRDILTLVRILRIAVLLNKSRQATNQANNVQLSVKNNEWFLTFEPDFLAQNPLIAQDLLDEQHHLAQLELTLHLA